VAALTARARRPMRSFNFVVSQKEQIMMRLCGCGSAVAALFLAWGAPAAAQPTRAEHQNNLKQIGLALHTHHDVYKSLPTAAITDKDGKPLLSWRVAILPFIGEADLYGKFKLDEPWDSPHNLKLVEQMPKVFGAPSNKKEDAGKTRYRVFTGPGTVFDGKKGIRLTDILDGTSNTILAVEADEPVVWTMPAELEYLPKGPLPRFDRNGKNGFSVLMCDGSVMTFRSDFNEQQMRFAILRADGNPIDLKQLER
jgi:hypothetical protein